MSEQIDSRVFEIRQLFRDTLPRPFAPGGESFSDDAETVWRAVVRVPAPNDDPAGVTLNLTRSDRDGSGSWTVDGGVFGLQDQEKLYSRIFNELNTLITRRI